MSPCSERYFSICLIPFFFLIRYTFWLVIHFQVVFFLASSAAVQVNRLGHGRLCDMYLVILHGMDICEDISEDRILE